MSDIIEEYILKYLKSIKFEGNDTYFKFIDQLTLVDESKYQWIVSVMGYVNENIKDTTLKENMLTELSVLAAINKNMFFIQNNYKYEILERLKFLSENIFRIMKYTLSTDEPQPEPYLEYSHNVSTELIERVKTTHSKEELIVLKNDLFQILHMLLKHYNLFSQSVNPIANKV